MQPKHLMHTHSIHMETRCNATYEMGPMLLQKGKLNNKKFSTYSL